MSPRHVSKQMFSPYFQSDHYKNESKEIKMQNQIESIVAMPIGVLIAFFKSRRRNHKQS